MKLHIALSAAAASAVLAAGLAAQATPLVLAGDYIKVGISDAGTLGSGGDTPPGLLHDPTGKGNFGINDYLTPGIPHEGFSIVSDQTGFMNNDNQSPTYAFLGSHSPTLLTGADAKGFANAATWSGGARGVEVTNSYFFNPGDQRILVETTLTAQIDLSGLAFARSIDPDPDVRTFGVYDTDNRRGNAYYGVDDFVGSAGAHTGLTLALINLSGDTWTHTTEVNYQCCSNINPYSVLSGFGGKGDVSSGDYSLNMAWSLGELAAGKSVTLAYEYAVGDHIDTVGGPPSTSGGVPEPGVWALMLAGFGLVGATLRRRPAQATAY